MTGARDVLEEQASEQVSLANIAIMEGSAPARDIHEEMAAMLLTLARQAR